MSPAPSKKSKDCCTCRNVQDPSPLIIAESESESGHWTATSTTCASLRSLIYLATYDSSRDICFLTLSDVCVWNLVFGARLWGRYQELGESLVAESEGGHRSDLDLESEGEYRGENGYRSDLDPSCNGPGHDDGGKTQRDGLGVWDEGRGPSPGEECCEDVDVDERKQMSGQSEDADVDEGVEVCSRAGGETAYVDEQAGVGGDARSLQPRASQSKGVDEGVDDFWAEKVIAQSNSIDIDLCVHPAR